MALPKRKTSKSSRDQRRHSAWRLRIPGLVPCSRCHEPKLPYHACPSCGFYGSRKVLELKQAKAKAE
ncbi:MAG: 50S ribosomal protein L32 [Armatimonadota bacterium]